MPLDTSPQSCLHFGATTVYAPEGVQVGGSMKILKENETKLFNSEKEALATFSEIDKKSIWQRCYTKELEAVGLLKAPILIEQIKANNCFSHEVSDESITESIEGVNLAVNIPSEYGKTTYPLADSGMSSIMQRAGYGIDSSSLRKTKDSRSKSVMDPLKKAMALNFGLETAEDQSLVFILDEKVRAVHSGDTMDYARLPFSELVSVFKDGLASQFADVQFIESSVDYYFSSIMYRIEDSEISKAISEVLSMADIETAGLKTTVRLVSSDVGASGANIYPCLIGNCHYIALGKPLSLTHKSNHSLADFSENVGKVVAMFKDATEKLEEMGNLRLKHPDGCLLRLAKQCGLSKKISCERAPEFSNLYGSSASLLDCWWELNEIYEKMFVDDNHPNPTKRIQLQEAIARVCFSADLTEYDIPFQWE